MTVKMNNSGNHTLLIGFILAHLFDDTKKENLHNTTRYILDLPSDIITLLVKIPVIVRILRKIDINKRIKCVANSPEAIPKETLTNIAENNEKFRRGEKVTVFIKHIQPAYTGNPIISLTGNTNPTFRNALTDKSYYFAGTPDDLGHVWGSILKQLKNRIRCAYFVSSIEENDDRTSKIDRITAQSRLAIIKHLYTKRYLDLPNFEEILEKRRRELNRNLSFEETFSVLSDAGEYINSNFICRSIGNLIIRFDYKAYLTDAKTNEIFNNTTSNSDEEELINLGLRNMKLNKLVHQLAYLILHEVYVQRKYDGQSIILDKKYVIRKLGFDENSTSIYEDIDKALFALYYLEFLRYSFSNKHDESRRNKILKEECGRFITEISKDAKRYNLCVGKNFIGCITNTGSRDVESFRSGYFEWNPIILHACRDYSTAGYLLVQLLLSETGNKILQTNEYKVIAFKTETLISRLKIEYNQYSKAVKHLTEAIVKAKNDGFIVKVEPDLSRKPALIRDITIKLYVRKKLKDIVKDVRLKSTNTF